MLALAIIFTSLLLIALLRFGFIAEYSEAGFDYWISIGFIKIRLSGKEKTKKVKKEKKKKESSVVIKPGSMSIFLDMLKAVKNALSRLKRRLLIKQLTLYYMSAGDDPATTALLFGTANAVYNTIIPALERNFRIRKRDLRASADFTATEQKIYAKIAISIAVWEVFYIIFALFPIITAIFKSKPVRKQEKKTKNKPETIPEAKTDQEAIKTAQDIKDRKDGQTNGEQTD